MKRLTSFLAVFFCTIGVLLWVAQSFVSTWEPQLRSKLEVGLGRILHAHVEIDSLSLSFLHRIHLSNVQVWDLEKPRHLQFRASDIALTVSLIDLPRALADGSPLESIGLVALDSPWVVASPQLLQKRISQNTATGTGRPLLFTLTWDHGTFQYLDTQAPHGRWTIYQARGTYKIRGPHMELAARGILEQAQQFRLDFSSFGRRWRSVASIHGGDIPGVLGMSERMLHKRLLPEGWNAAGRFTLEAEFSGHRIPSSGDNPGSFLEKGTLSFAGAKVETGAGARPIRLTGTLHQQGTRTSTSDLALSVDHKTLFITGNAWFFGAEPRTDIRGNCRDFDLSLLATYLGGPGWLQGQGDMQFSATGPVADSDITLTAKIPQGILGRWPFHDAALHLRRVHRHWEFIENHLKLLDGEIGLKGYASPEENDLQITGERISLEQLSFTESWSPVQGRLNFAAKVKGPGQGLTTSGSFWASDFAWANSPLEGLHGDFELGPQHFEGQAESDRSSYRFAVGGHRSPAEIGLDRLEIGLPSGASLTGQGTVRGPMRTLLATFEARTIQVPRDISFLKNWIPLVRGTFDAHAQVAGTLFQPILTGTLSSENLQIGQEAPTRATATVRWDPTQIAVEKFSIRPGLEGHWRQALPLPGPWQLQMTLNNARAEWISALALQNSFLAGTLSGYVTLNRLKTISGAGSFALENGMLGKMPVTKALATFTMRAGEFLAKGVDIETAFGHTKLHGRATWPVLTTESKPVAVALEGQGQIDAGEAKDAWIAPIDLHGTLFPADHWRGHLDLAAKSIVIRKQVQEPLTGKVVWDRSLLSWSDFRWGPHWKSEGSITFHKASPEIAASIEAHDVALASLQTLFWLKAQESVDGLLSGLLTLTGTTNEPTAHFSGHIGNALWRAFKFTSDFQGRWNKNGVEPLTLTAASDTGGTLAFRGSLNASGVVQGSLKLANLNLQPLGQSLHLPKPVAGNSQGTLTVNGPLKRLSLTGHVEGGPIRYGDNNPFSLEHYTLDLALRPTSEHSETMRLVVAEGIASTKEEQIRLNPGSYVDFSGDKQARLLIGSEIRNLHLGIFTLFGGLDLDGTWQIRPAGIAINGDVHTRSLFINDYELEEGHVNADYYNGVLRFAKPARGSPLITGSLDIRGAPQLKFHNFFISGKEGQGLQLTGDIGPAFWDFWLNGRRMDMGTLGGLAGFPYPLEGTSDVSIRGTGDLAHPHVEGTVQLQDGRAIGLGFHSGSAAFVWQDYRIAFTRLLLTDPGRYTLTGAGVFPLASKDKSRKTDKGMDFSVRLQDSNLGLLKSFSKEVREAKGPVEGILQMTGSAEQPVLRGFMKVLDGDVVGAHYFKHLNHFSMSLNFEGDELVVHEFRGQSGNGEFSITGKIPFAGYEPRSYDLRADVTSSRGLAVQVPELAIPESPLAKRFRFLTTASHCDVKGHVSFFGPADAPTFKGEGNFSNGHFSFPPSQKNPPPAALMEWFRRINWEVDLRFSDGAWFENELVEANLAGALRLRGPSDRLRVDGGMDITEGKISYLGLAFDIQQARYDIRSEEGDHGINNTPYVRGVAQSNVQAVDTVNGGSGDPTNRLDINDTITLYIDYAPVDQIKPRLASLSNPNLSQEKLLARVTQLDAEKLSPQERNYLYQQQMVRLIDTSLATPLARNILKRTGLVDTFRVSRVINPSQAPNADTTATATQQQQTAVNLFANTKYTFEKNLSGRLSLGYGVRFEQSVAPDTLQSKLDLINDVEMSYRWFRNVYLRGVFDLPSSNPTILPNRQVTIEPRWRFGWWGHTNKSKLATPEKKKVKLSPELYP